MPIQNKEI